MADDDQNGRDNGETASPPPGTASSATSDNPFKDLADDLAALEGEKADYEAKTVEANIAELKKLIDDGKKALEPYETTHAALVAEQNRLENFKAGMAPDLLDNCLPDTAKTDVEKAVADAIAEIDAAEKKVGDLGGRIPSGDSSTSQDPWQRGSVGAAKLALAASMTGFEVAKSRLDHLKTLSKAVETRLKAAKGFEAEIRRLATGGKPATAYWLLTQGEAKDAAGHVVIDGAAFFTGQLDGEPMIIDPSQLVADLTQAWKDFKAARSDVATKKAALKTAEDALQAEKTKLADLKRDLVKTIRATLEAYDENRVKSAA